MAAVLTMYSLAGFDHVHMLSGPKRHRYACRFGFFLKNIPCAPPPPCTRIRFMYMMVRALWCAFSIFWHTPISKNCPTWRSTQGALSVFWVVRYQIISFCTSIAFVILSFVIGFGAFYFPLLFMNESVPISSSSTKFGIFF